jgi:Tol biopolymer transport system component
MKNRFLPAVFAVCGLLLVIVTVCYVVCAPTSLCFFVDRWVSSPDYSPDGERIVYVCHYPTLSQVLKDVPDDLGQSSSLLQWGYIWQATEICIANVDGKHQARLTNNQATDGLPTWSPDGLLIAYISDPPHAPGSTTGQALYAVSGNGSERRKLSEDLKLTGEKPTWSPDGKKVSFAATDPLKQELGVNLYAAGLESGEVHALTYLPGDELGALWSPDGTQLALVWYPEGYGGPCSVCSDSAAIQIIDVEGDNNTVAEGFAAIGGLTWSPAGTRLAFWGSQSTDCPDDDCRELYVLDLSNGSMECLTGQYELTWIDDTAWAPDGKQIAFVARTGREAVDAYTGQPDREVVGPAFFAIELASGKLLRISESGIPYPANLTWAPDAKSLAFNSGFEGDKSHIWFVEMENGKLRRLRVR